MAVWGRGSIYWCGNCRWGNRFVGRLSLLLRILTGGVEIAGSGALFSIVLFPRLGCN